MVNLHHRVHRKSRPLYNIELIAAADPTDNERRDRLTEQRRMAVTLIEEAFAPLTGRSNVLQFLVTLQEVERKYGRCRLNSNRT